VDAVFHVLGLRCLEPRRGLLYVLRKLQRLMARRHSPAPRLPPASLQPRTSLQATAFPLTHFFVSDFDDACTDSPPYLP